MPKKKRDDDTSSDDGVKRRRHDSPDRYEKRKKKSAKKSEKKEKDKKHRKNDDDSDRSSSSGSDSPAMAKARRGQSRISTEDYYAKSTEYIVWLKDAKGKFLDELDGKASRKYFKKFIKRWNRGKLDAKLYEGLQPTDLSSNQRSQHQWKIKGMNDEEAGKLDDLKASIVRKSAIASSNGIKGRLTASGEDFTRGKPKPRTIGPSMPTDNRRPEVKRPAPEEDMDEEDLRRYNRALDKKDKKSFQKTHEAGCRRACAKSHRTKRKQASAFHKQEREVDVELPESELLGMGTRLLQLWRENVNGRSVSRNEKQQRSSIQSEKVTMYKAKEDATMAMLRGLAEQNHGARQL
ncbi:hypothetical protein BC829DRAFT_470959 [Chytridium lagenaria]|nr:hypothetical protein BC829DRAFT_470959 [Chytridium lagenaria]